MRDSAGAVPSVTQKVARWILVMPLCLTSAVFSGATLQSSATVASEPDASNKATLSISLKRGAVRGRSGRFEFFDASDGCPEEYVDIPGAKVFLVRPLPQIKALPRHCR